MHTGRLITTAKNVISNFKVQFKIENEFLLINIASAFSIYFFRSKMCKFSV